MIDWGETKTIVYSHDPTKWWVSLVELKPGDTFVLRELGPTWQMTDRRGGDLILCINTHNGMTQDFHKDTKVKQIR